LGRAFESALVAMETQIRDASHLIDFNQRRRYFSCD
jgi:hypothetical protein